MEDERIDFTGYQRRTYDILVDVGPNVGDDVDGVVTVSQRPFLLLYLKHQIVTDANLAPLPPVQDGLYRIDFSIEETQRFHTGPTPMADSFGSIRHGIWDRFSPPHKCEPNETLNVTITNAFLRAAGADYQVQIQFEGYEKLVEGATRER